MAHRFFRSCRSRMRVSSNVMGILKSMRTFRSAFPRSSYAKAGSAAASLPIQKPTRALNNVMMKRTVDAEWARL
ncbi:MAG: hypothetical protein DMF91_20010 [Acidobacteria bacterium]|nr:MAG: hypothetical protein DMF91_20010 [Acidobacteriota bacterium]